MTTFTLSLLVIVVAVVILVALFTANTSLRESNCQASCSRLTHATVSGSQNCGRLLSKTCDSIVSPRQRHLQSAVGFSLEPLPRAAPNAVANRQPHKPY